MIRGSPRPSSLSGQRFLRSPPPPSPPCAAAFPASGRRDQCPQEGDQERRPTTMSSSGPRVVWRCSTLADAVQLEDDQHAERDAGQVGAEQVAQHQPLRVRHQHHHRHRRQQGRREHRQQREEEDAEAVAHAAILPGTIGPMKQRVSLITLGVADLGTGPRLLRSARLEHRRRARRRRRLLRGRRHGPRALGPGPTRRGQLRRGPRRLGRRDAGAEPRLAGRSRRGDRGGPSRRRRRSAASRPRPSGAATAASSSTPTAIPGRSPTTRTGG